MSLKISAEDLIPCVYRFLVKFGHTAAAKALEKSADVEPRGGISTKKLLKIGKFYLKHHPELIAKEESEEEEEEVKPVKSKKTEKTVNGKRKPTKEESEEEEEEEEKPVKESKKKLKTEKASASGSRKQSKTIEEEDDEEEEETTKKSQKNKVKEHAPIKEKSAAKAAKVIEEEDYEGEEEQVNNHTGRFSYVDHSVLNGVPIHLQDNTFESKTTYGNGGDAFGQFGHERLIHTRGKGFTKEKNKLKNKQFHGGAGRINAHVQNSIKLSYSDDE